MEQSILLSVKKALGVSPDDESFDLDIMMYINGEFSTLNGLGVGPAEGFVIEDESSEWSEFIDPDEDETSKVKLSQAKTCVILRTRLLFDPPTQAFLLEAVKDQLREFEWRLNVNRENEEWVDPNPRPPLIPSVVVEEVE
jgi:hypothetical protein